MSTEDSIGQKKLAYTMAGLVGLLKKEKKKKKAEGAVDMHTPLCRPRLTWDASASAVAQKDTIQIQALRVLLPWKSAGLQKHN